MSKELKGINGKIVGEMKYFQENNTGCVIGKMVDKYKFNYYDTIKSISKDSIKIFDEVYSDLENNEPYLCYIDKNNKSDTIEILEGMKGICEIVGDSTTVADKCIKILSSYDKSKSGASDKDITKSAEFVINNKYFNKKESTKILEDCIKKKVTRATNGKSDMEKFMKEVCRSTKSGYLEDILLKVNYLESGKKLIGKCGKTLCSKEYNKHVSDVVVIAKYVIGSEAYGKAVIKGLNLVASKLNKDLDKGIKDNDYIKSKHIENIKKCVKDLEKCGEKKYNLINKANKLDWFVCGDFDKILRLQRKINSQNLVIKVEEDGVYSEELEQAWITYLAKSILEYKLPPGLKLVDYVFDNYNFVIGLGHYGSAHATGGGTIGYMVYIDDDYNIAIMSSISVESTTDIEWSVGLKGEISFDANEASDMAGDSLTYGVDASTPIVELGVNGGYSKSFGNGSVTSYSGSISYGNGILPVGISSGASKNVLLIQFNPIEELKKYINLQ